MTQELRLGRSGLVALIDDADLTKVGSRRWYAHESNSTYYARADFGPGHDPRWVLLHSLLTGWPLVDHINGDGLDNRRVNLRPATPSENAMNRGMRSDNTSGRKGVTWCKVTRSWSARIWVNGRNLNLGRFADLDEAAAAYDDAAIKHFGAFARPNRKDAA